MINNKPRGISFNQNALNVRPVQQQAPNQQLVDHQQQDNLKAAALSLENPQQQLTKRLQLNLNKLAANNGQQKIISDENAPAKQLFQLASRDLLDKLGDKLLKPKQQLKQATDENALAFLEPSARVNHKQANDLKPAELAPPPQLKTQSDNVFRLQQQAPQQLPKQVSNCAAAAAAEDNLIELSSCDENIDVESVKQLPASQPIINLKLEKPPVLNSDSSTLGSRIPRLSLRFPQPLTTQNPASAPDTKNAQPTRKLLFKRVIRRPIAEEKAAQRDVQEDEEDEDESERVRHEEEEPIEDIDKSSSRDAMFLVCDIAADIYDYMYALEEEQSVKRDFLKDQKIFTPKVRQRLVNWCIEINSQLKLLPETLYMTISVIDRFFQQVQVKQQSQVQLVAVAATLIASKYEEIYPPDVADLIHLTQNSYSKREILRAEIFILEQLNFNLGKPIPPAFLRRFSRAAQCDQKMHTIAKHLMELSLSEYECAHWPPSMVAAAALYATIYMTHQDQKRTIMGSLTRNTSQPSSVKAVMKNRWNRTMVHYTHYTSQQLNEPASNLAKILKRAQKSPQNHYTVKKNMQVVGKWSELKSSRVDDLIKLADHQ